MPRCLISFGANLGNARSTIERAAEQLQDKLTTATELFQLSPLYKTPPVGGPSGQPPFINAVAAVQTDRSPWEVWQAVRDVEQDLGRERFLRWEARRIDLDILLFDDARIWTPQLKIPHPRMCMRRFILAPAAHVAGDWLDPVTGQSIAALATALDHGRGSLMLCADPAARPELLLEEVARHTLAKWQTVLPIDGSSYSAADLQTETAYNTSVDMATDSTVDHTSRWVALAPTQLRTLVGDKPPRSDFAELESSKTESSKTESSKTESSKTQPTEARAQESRPPETGLAVQPAQVNLTPAPKLVVFLVDAQTSSGAQWEDLYRGLARRLNLAESPAAETSQPTRWGSYLPRYLLATDDRQWAVHELVAALEAMDCPIEQLR
jgi:2-amino-4-hydroxy-6-hydroxymethyldihydropteridine diphosphokinase